MDTGILKLLYRSLDSPLKKKERLRLDRALEESEELRQLRSELVAMRQAITEGAVRSFRPQFVERTMSRIQPTRSPANKWDVLLGAYRTAFRFVAIVGLIIIAVLISYNIAHKDLLPQDAIFYASDLTIGKLLQMPVF